MTVLPVAASDLAPRTPAHRDEVRRLLPKRCALVALAPAPVAPIARAHAEDVIVDPDGHGGYGQRHCPPGQAKKGNC